MPDEAPVIHTILLLKSMTLLILGRNSINPYF